MRKNILAVIFAAAISVTAAEYVAPEYQGFQIDPLPGWRLMPDRQRPDLALLGRTDTRNPHHTVVAEVRISPVAPRRLTMSEVRQAVEEKMKRQETDRIREFKFTLKESVVSGTPALEIRTGCLDAGTRPISRMESLGFMLITRDNRLLSVTVSERSDEVGFRLDDKAAAEFFNAVHW